MPRLLDIVTAPPPFVVDQSVAAEFARGLFANNIAHLDRLMPIFANSGIARRHICQPPSWYQQEHGLDERSNVYIDVATTQCAKAGRELLERQNVDPADIDRIYYINTTGLATPSIDARLVNVLGLNRHVRRTPIWGLGCAGGVAGLSLAAHDLVGHPKERALVFAAEMCTLTFLRDDFTKSNLVALALFSDGAAAALLEGDDVSGAGYPILGSRSTLFADSLNVMGWNVVSRGLQVVFDKRIPVIVEEHAARELDALLESNGLTRADVDEFLYHPGGPKVLNAYAEAYGVDMERFAWSRDVLAEHGNMSSVTVLYVLASYMAAHPPGRGGRAVVSALGPGFSSEAFLMGL